MMKKAIALILALLFVFSVAPLSVFAGDGAPARAAEEEQENEEEILYGDCNGDGNVNGRDLIRLRKFLDTYDAETGGSGTEIFAGADCNGDGTINGRDIIRLRKHFDNYDAEENGSFVYLGPKMPEDVGATPDWFFTFHLLPDGTYEVSAKEEIAFPSIIFIPASHNGVPVTRLGSFPESYLRQSILIPDTIRAIADNAFFTTGQIQYEPYRLQHFNRYDNAVYLGSESNPYMILLAAWEKSIQSVTIHKDTKFIHSYAFYGCSRLKAVDIPEGVIGIGSGAFSYCDDLKDVSIPDSVDQFGTDIFYLSNNINTTEYGGGLYFGNETNPYIVLMSEADDKTDSIEIHENTKVIKRIRSENLTSVSIPDGVVRIDRNAFSFGNENLECVHLGSGMKSIGEEAFMGCSKLREINIPRSVTSVGENAFDGCDSLIVTSYEGGLYLGDENPYYLLLKAENTGVSQVRVHEKTRIIMHGAFAGCDSIAKLTLPFIGGSRTENTYLSYIFGSQREDDWNCLYSLRTSCEILLTEKCTTIPDYAFYYFKNLYKVTLPSSIQSIGKCAFFNCDGITGIVIPDSVKYIGNEAFNDCNRLTAINIPDSLEDIGVFLDFFVELDNLNYNEYENGFYLGNDSNPYVVFVKGKDPEITTITINENTEFIAAGALRYQTNLNSVTVGGKVKKIGAEAFISCSSLESISLPESVENIGNNAFGYSGLKEITIPSKVKSIGEWAFYYNSDLEKVTLPDGIQIIQRDAFGECEKLENVNMPKNLYAICAGAFENCENLSNIDLPTGLRLIGASAFEGCKSISEIVIPETVRLVDDRSFALCRNVTSAIIGSAYVGDGVFYGCGNLVNVTISDNVCSIRSAFENCDAIKAVYINDIAHWCSLDFESNPLEYAEALYVNGIPTENIVLPDGAKIIGERAFCGFKGIKSIVVPDSVVSIGYSAFYHCVNLESAIVADGVTEISQYVFCGCTNLKSVYIGNGVQNIPYYAFYGCKNLTDVTLGYSIRFLADYSFGYCEILTTINFNGTRAQWKAIQKADYWNRYASKLKYVICIDD